MKLTVLTENTACRGDLRTVHGLSLWIESGKHRVLLDVGPGDEFAENAKVLGVFLEEADLCVISHGHDDHGGGLGRFLQENSHAPVYLAEGAFAPHFAGEENISLDADLKNHPRIHTVGAVAEIAPEITLFSQVPGEKLVPKANGGLTDAQGPDEFLHEQDLLIREDGRLYLFGGCAHRGIVNILERAKDLTGRYPDVVVSGLHLAAGGTGRCMADEAYLDELSAWLLSTGAKFYTCHCTGPAAYSELKDRIGEHLEAISTGMVLDI